MSEFSIEDLPKNQKEFDEHFSSEQACYEYLFHMRWPQGSDAPAAGTPAAG